MHSTRPSSAGVLADYVNCIESPGNSTFVEIIQTFANLGINHFGPPGKPTIPEIIWRGLRR